MGKEYGRIEKYDFHALKSTGTATGNNQGGLLLQQEPFHRSS